jgi:hypothetical protein
MKLLGLLKVCFFQISTGSTAVSIKDLVVVLGVQRVAASETSLLTLKYHSNCLLFLRLGKEVANLVVLEQQRAPWLVDHVLTM